MGRTEVGREFLNDLLSRIPEEKRALAQEAFEAAGDEVVNFAGDGALRQQDYSRNLTAVKKTEAEQLAWWEANQARLAAAPAAPTPAPAPAAAPAATLAKEEILGLIDQREAGVANFISFTTTLAAKHQLALGEVLDLPTLMSDPEIQKLGLQGVYDKKFGARYQEIATAARTKELSDAEERGRLEERRNFANRPLHLKDPGAAGSPLDALEPATPGQNDSVVDAAVNHYETLRQQAYAPRT